VDKVVKKDVQSNFLRYDDNWIHNYLNPILSSGAPSELVSEEIEKNTVGTDIHLMPIFSQRFCDTITKMASEMPEQNWTKGRHEHYPTNDILLKDFDARLYEVFQLVLQNWLLPHALNIYQIAGKKAEDFADETFLVRYTIENQSYLDTHMDSSYFTFNTALNNNFLGGGTYFKKYNLTLQPQPGWSVLAPSLVTHKHGARPISEGVRYMLISFIHPIVQPAY